MLLIISLSIKKLKGVIHMPCFSTWQASPGSISKGKQTTACVLFTLHRRLLKYLWSLYTLMEPSQKVTNWINSTQMFLHPGCKLSQAIGLFWVADTIVCWIACWLQSTSARNVHKRRFSHAVVNWRSSMIVIVSASVASAQRAAFLARSGLSTSRTARNAWNRLVLPAHWDRLWHSSVDLAPPKQMYWRKVSDQCGSRESASGIPS